MCGARVKPFLQRDLRDFLFVEEDKRRRGELVLVSELGFRIFFQERGIFFFTSFVQAKESKREKKREAS